MRKLIVITSPHFIDNEAMRINILMASGLFRLHIRKPTQGTPADTNAVIKKTDDLISNIYPVFYDRISIHYYHSLAEKYRLGGVHLSSCAPVPPIGFGGLVSSSCHTLDEVAQMKRNCDYVFLSPIFNSISKKGYTTPFDSATLKQAAREGIIDNKVIALGGITSANAANAIELGFGGVAVLGAIWG